MTVRKYTSRSQQTTLSAAVTSGATVLSVTNAATLLAGTVINAGQTFTIVIDPDTALEEIVDVYSPTVNPVSGNNLTVVRAVDMSGASAQDHSSGAVVRHMIIGRDLRESNLHVEATAAYNDGTGTHSLHGLGSGDGDLVGTDKAQTLTNKTINAASNTLTGVVTLTGTQTLTNKTLTSPTITGTGAIAGTFTGNLTGNVTGNVTGNASSATTLATARDFQIVGDVEASAQSFNGSGNITLTTAIATGAIVNADVNASAAIAKTKIDGTAVTLADSGTVTSTMIANDTIVDADISATAAITKTKLNLGGTITSADLVDGTIVAADIANATLTAAKFVTDPYARANHTGTQTASTISDFNTQVRTNRLDQMAAPTSAVSANSQKITNLGLATSNGDAVSVAWIDSQKNIANGIAGLDSNGKVPFEHIPATAIAEVFVVSSQAAMLALDAGVGDIAIRSDLNKSFILRVTPATTLSNWNELLTPIDAVLSVDGATGAVDLTGVYLNKTTGVLAGNLNANSHKVTNLATPTNSADAATKAYVDTVAGSADAAAASAAAAATSYDDFDDRYLGAKSTPPTLDNDGNTLLVGAIYWNTVSNNMFAWTGSAWGSISSTADIYRYRYTAAGGETSESGPDDNGLTLSYIPGKEQVYLNGVLLLRTTDYNATSGTSITSLAALAAGDVLEIITFTAFELANVLSPTLFDAKGDLLAGTGADTVGKLTVGTNGQYLQADSSTATGLTWSTVTGYSAPTIGSTAITSGATITTLNGVTDIVLTGAGSIQDELTLLLMGAL
jgi:hypothetical protein